MIFSVPLQLEVVDAVIHRLDPVSTHAFDPPGAKTSGHSDVFREPVVFDQADGSGVETRQEATQYLPEIRVPCQVETTLYEDQRMAFSGNLPQSDMTLVMHRRDLEPLGLIDEVTRNILLKIGDRISRFERHRLGVMVLKPEDPGLFITQVFPGSWGFGTDGHDLHMITLERRDEGGS